MRKSLKLAFALVLTSSAAQADTLPRPTASYDATATSDIGNNHSTSTVNAMGQKLRVAVTTSSGPVTVLVDRALNQAYVMIPALGTTMPVTQKMMGGYDLNALNTIQLTPEGPDAINGIEATRYAVDTQVKPGQGFTGHVWATQDGAILAVDGTATSGTTVTPVKIVLSGFQRRAQNPALFIARAQPMAANPWIAGLMNAYKPAR